MIHLYTKRSPQGYLGAFVLQLMFPDKEVHVTYDNNYRMQNEPAKLDPEAEIIIFLGYPYDIRYQEVIDDNLGTIINPFTKVYHFCSYGDEFKEGNVVSKVNEVESPVYELVGMLKPLATAEQSRLALADEWTALGDDYHRFDFSVKRQMSAMDFRELTRNLNEYMYEILGTKTVAGVAREFQTFIQAFNVMKEDRIKTNLRTISVQLEGDILVAIGYEEEYINELAHRFIDNALKQGFKHVVVLLGRKTRGDDIFSVRTTEGLHAGELAKYLNNGDGKERVASVFLGNARAHTHEVIYTMIREYKI